MTSSKPRKPYWVLVDDLIDALPVRRDATVEEIRRKAGCGWSTASRWLDLIIHIQELPRVMKSRRPSGQGDVYKRERRKGE